MKIEDILGLCKLEMDYRIKGNADTEIEGLNLCNRETIKKSVLSYAVSDAYIEDVTKNKNIKAIITNRDNHSYDDLILPRRGCIIFCEDPESMFYDVHEVLCKSHCFYPKYDFISAIGNDCTIHPSVIIENGVIIGNRVTIGPNSVIRKGSIIDNNVTIGCCSVIGSEGFQLIKRVGKPPMHITHVGRCHICEDVYIGDNTCVCNSLFEGETYVGKGAKIDNLVHVAHNLYIGEGAVVTAQAILCGSSRIERNSWIAPNAAILNRVDVGEGSLVGLGAVVVKDVEPNTVVYGSPAKAHK